MARFVFSIVSCVLFTSVIALPKYSNLRDTTSRVDDADKYLGKYGSSPCEKLGDSDTDNPLCPRSFESMLESFQKAHNLPVKYEPDPSMSEKMKPARCGNSDEPESIIDTKTLWPTNRTLIWRLDFANIPFNSMLTRQIFQQSFDEWSKYTDLTFREAIGNEKADFNIVFLSGEHGDSKPFDGPGGELAHAWLPSSLNNRGISHFDERQPWSETYDNTSYNLRLVATHEIGHTLGLTHSNNRNALMHDEYHLVPPNQILSTDDQNRIQSLYPKKEPETTTIRTIPTTAKRPIITTTDCNIRYTYDGYRYVGQCKNGMRHGRGAYMWPNKDKYEGNWMNDKQHGRGKFTWANGEIYRGNWVDNKRTGQGLRTFRNGDYYNGQFKDDNYHGHGTFFWINNGTYKGNYADGYMHGKGIRTWSNGRQFEGKFDKNKPVDGDMTTDRLKNNVQAQNKCPNVCQEIGLKWQSHWENSVKTSTSICRCVN